ncbi:CCA tRNA nucleotidyltransferase [Jeotgalibacillus aurantiacus]|uniref:CCA tRNA nucleotidyltransferase n=1 Tax=Jeotgalibacillus aurantiacus TaxID=2763266 RepID=UPI001D0A53A8|nr:CCA tRNA nucleotidyltransferase [Jeotgalibacillus aurantiacus]
MNPLFEQAKPVLKSLESSGFEAYFVGGCVRDHILGRAIHDIDIATSATPEEVKGVFERTVDVGIDHGTVLVLTELGQYEITTFRTESAYTDFRRPDHVSFVRSLKEDLKRRDFTINAMAMTADYKIIDLFQGTTDLERKILRTVGSADERFSEDALRMLRGARFAAQLGFSLDRDTRQAMIQLAHLLEHVAVERKRMELDKLLAGAHMIAGLNVLMETGLLPYLPRLLEGQDTIDRLTQVDWTVLNGEERLVLIYALDKKDHVKQLLKAWRYSNRFIQKLHSIYELLSVRKKGYFPIEIRYQYDLEHLISAEKIYAVVHQIQPDLERIRKDHEKMPIRSKKDIKATGTDLISWTGQKGGPWVKEALSQIEMDILYQRLGNSEAEIKEWVKTWFLKSDDQF